MKNDEVGLDALLKVFEEEQFLDRIVARRSRILNRNLVTKRLAELSATDSVAAEVLCVVAKMLTACSTRVEQPV